MPVLEEVVQEKLKKPQRKKEEFIIECSAERALKDQSELVTIFVVCRNRVKTIRRCLDSIINQSYKNIEILVQDGVSTDGTLEVLREYEQKLEGKMKVISEPDNGPEEAFWRVLKRCRGKYIGSCMTDEELLPDAVALGVDFMRQNPTAGAMTSDMYRTDLDGNIVEKSIGYEFDVYRYIAAMLMPNFPASFFRKEALLGIGLLERSWNLNCGEFEFWARLGLKYPVVYVPVLLAKYAEHTTQNSLNCDIIFRLVKGRFEVIEQLFQEYPQLKQEGLQKTCLISTAHTFANLLRTMKMVVKAQDLFKKCVEHRPELADALEVKPLFRQYCTAAYAKVDEGNLNEALRIFSVASLANKTDPRPIYEQAMLLSNMEYKNKAIAVAKKMLSQHPTFLLGYDLIARIHEGRGEIEEALEAWKKTYPLGNSGMHSYALHTMLKSLESTSESLLQEHLAWAERYARPLKHKQNFVFRKDFENREIRVGYHWHSWDHFTISSQLFPILKHHNRSKFKLIAYDDGKEFDDPANFAHVPKYFDEVRMATHLTDEQYIDQVRADEIDILVELCGHSARHRFQAMASRCAPVQISYLNYTCTCGTPNVDYVIADPVATQPEDDKYFTETVYRLPGCFFCFNYEEENWPEPTPPPIEKNGYITFGCFAAGSKVNHLMVKLWSEVLKQCENSILVIRNSNLTSKDDRDHLIKRFAAHDIPSSRLVLYQGGHRDFIMKLYRDVDIVFDTLPYNGGNSVAEPLWQGVPVLSLKGKRFSSAYGASLLQASGCPELVATSKEEYVAKAVELAKDIERLRFYRKNLRKMMFDHGLADGEKFARKLETAYLDMLSKVK